MSKLSLHLFGQPQIVYNNTNITHTLPIKAQAILIYLAVTGQTQTRLWLGSLLWPDVEERRALKNLRDVLPVLRQQFPDHLFITRQTLAFNRDQAYFLDTELFQNNLHVAALTDEQRHETLNLYQGEFLAGFYVPHADLFGEWQMMWRERLHELALYHMDTLVEQAVPRPEKWAMGLDLTQRLLELEPWRESAHRQRMLLLAYTGKRETAVSQYELCRQTLVAEFGIEPTSQTRLLYEQIVAGEMSQVVRQANSPAGPAPQLPRTLTPFFGRQEELTAVTNHLRHDHYPLVTIMGEGGIGKTRLAIAAAQKVAADFPGGVWFVPLAHLPHAPDAQIAVEQLLGAMADVLATAVVQAHKTTAANLVQIIGNQRILLVLDNFEHLSAGKNLLLDLLTNCPRLTLLITSRERLNMQAEMVVRLSGLPVPDETQAIHMPNLITMSSLQLFTERASRIAPDFILDDSNLADVVRICQLVEGLPLAIEMAAALTAYQSCAAIRAALTANYNALSALGQDDLPGRHQSLQAVPLPPGG